MRRRGRNLPPDSATNPKCGRDNRVLQQNRREADIADRSTAQALARSVRVEGKARTAPINKIGFDRWNFSQLRPWLIAAGFSENAIKEHFAEFGQGTQSMSPALRELEIAHPRPQAQARRPSGFEYVRRERGDGGPRCVEPQAQQETIVGTDRWSSCAGHGGRGRAADAGALRRGRIDRLALMKTSDWDDPAIRAIGRRYAAEAYDLASELHHYGA